MFCFLVLLLGFNFRPVEATNWKTPALWANSLSKFIRSLSGHASTAAELEKRALNKTLWISAKVYEGDTFFEYVSQSSCSSLPRNVVSAQFVAGPTTHVINSEWDFYSGADFTQ